MPPTNSQVDRAGRVLREWRGPGRSPVTLREAQALDVPSAFRAAHGRPLAKANMGLRSMLRTEGCEVDVSQRLKRSATIVDKLSRLPSLSLSRMQDIGGCRAVVRDLDELRRVQARLARDRPPERISDYVAAPRESGYRSVHLIVRYDDRRIEVQLRTRVMHQWAAAVEDLGQELGADLKSGAGPAPILAWLRALSEAYALEETGGLVSDNLITMIERLREEARTHLEGR